MLKGFKEFIMRGNVVDLAIAVVIGTAFAAVIATFVSSIVTPIVNAAGGDNTNGLGFSLKHTPGVPHGSKEDVLGASTFIDFSAIINAIIVFAITAAVVYFVFVVPMAKVQQRRAAKLAAGDPDPEPKPEEILLLEQIRDLLAKEDPYAKQGAGATDRPKPG
jgi:large conductance mechanosensitive channel